MHPKLKDIWQLIKDTFQEFGKDDCFLYAGALAFYTLFSLAPILIIIITIATVFFGEDVVKENVLNQIAFATNAKTAELIKEVISNALQAGNDTVFATFLSISTLIVSATGLFYMLQSSLNRVWEVKAKPKYAFLKLLRDRLLSFGMIILVGALFLASLSVNLLISSLGQHIKNIFPAISPTILSASNFGLALLLITLLFAMVFRYLPDAKIRWRDVWIGAFATAVLFILGRYLMSFYISQSGIGSAYGTAGSVVILLIWVFYSSIVFFIGTEFTGVYAKHFGRQIIPVSYAVRIKRIEMEKE